MAPVQWVAMVVLAGTYVARGFPRGALALRGLPNIHLHTHTHVASCYCCCCCLLFFVPISHSFRVFRCCYYNIPSAIVNVSRARFHHSDPFSLSLELLIRIGIVAAGENCET